VPARQFHDPFGNVATRILVPGGRISMSADFQIEDHGRPDDHAPDARQIPVHDLPDEVLPFLLGSRYCDTDKLAQTAWKLFGGTPEGWPRVQAIVDTRTVDCASTTCRPTPPAAHSTATPSRSVFAATSLT
jgi:transglutaminase-like putative cysteine protease